MENSALLQTVSGKHKLDDHDRVLVHEHIFNRFPYWKREIMEKKVLKELEEAYNNGISIICDLTAYTKPYNYYNIIEKSPIKIISCIGFYTSRYIPMQQKKQSANELIYSLRKQIENGIGTKKIKPGIIKIAAEKAVLSDLEEKLFFVVATLSKDYKMPIALHSPYGAYDHVSKLVALGVDPKRLFVAHVESKITIEQEYDNRICEAKKILALGSFIQLSDFGCTLNSTKKDASLSFATEIIREGYVNQLLLSADSCWRFKNGDFHVKEYNLGNGKHYTYTKNFVLPLLCDAFPNLDIERIVLHDNINTLFT